MWQPLFVRVKAWDVTLFELCKKKFMFIRTKFRSQKPAEVEEQGSSWASSAQIDWLRLKSCLNQVQNTDSNVNWPHSSTGTEQPLGTGKAALCVCGLWRARTMLLLNSCHLWQLNYTFSADLWISVLCLRQKGCLGKMNNEQLWQIPGIQVLAGISKEATVTNRGPQHRTRPLRSRCLSPHHPGLGAGPGTHTWLRTWLPLQDTRECKPPPTPQSNRQETLPEWSKGVKILL